MNTWQAPTAGGSSRGHRLPGADMERRRGPSCGPRWRRGRRVPGRTETCRQLQHLDNHSFPVRAALMLGVARASYSAAAVQQVTERALQKGTRFGIRQLAMRMISNSSQAQNLEL